VLQFISYLSFKCFYQAYIILTVIFIQQFHNFFEKTKIPSSHHVLSLSLIFLKFFFRCAIQEVCLNAWWMDNQEQIHQPRYVSDDTLYIYLNLLTMTVRGVWSMQSRKSYYILQNTVVFFFFQIRSLRCSKQTVDFLVWVNCLWVEKEDIFEFHFIAYCVYLYNL
jgi:hypothetical protein